MAKLTKAERAKCQRAYDYHMKKMNEFAAANWEAAGELEYLKYHQGMYDLSDDHFHEEHYNPYVAAKWGWAFCDIVERDDWY